MIDETLARLIREAGQALDKLASDDFLKRQAELVEIEAQQAELADKRNAIAESLEADEAAVVAAQEALQAHFRGSDGVSPPVPNCEGTYGISEDELLEAVNQRYAERSDEFSDARAPYTNGGAD